MSVFQNLNWDNDDVVMIDTAEYLADLYARQSANSKLTPAQRDEAREGILNNIVALPETMGLQNGISLVAVTTLSKIQRNCAHAISAPEFGDADAFKADQPETGLVIKLTL